MAKISSVVFDQTSEGFKKKVDLMLKDGWEVAGFQVVNASGYYALMIKAA